MRRAFAFLLAAAMGCEGTSVGDLSTGIGELPEALDFGEVYVGGRSLRTIALRSTGTGPLLIEAIDVSPGGVFSIAPFADRIPAGAVAELEVTAAPIEPGVFEGSLVLTTDAGEMPSRIALVVRALPPIACDDLNPCTTDSFDANAGRCVYAPNDDACDDLDACTEGDRCHLGLCRGRWVDCDDGVDCTRDACDPGSGACLHEPSDAHCDDGDPCTDDRCDLREDCENPTSPNGTICGDVTVCVRGEICVFGFCMEHDVPEGFPCDDGNDCTTDDRCENDRCAGEGFRSPPELRATTIFVHAPASATFSGDYLYVSEARADPAVKVVRFDGDAYAPIEYGPVVEGGASWVLLGADTFARVATSSTGARRVERISVLNPARPTLGAVSVPGYRDREDTALSFSGDRLYFCAQRAPSLEAELVSYDFSQPVPGAPVYHGTNACADGQDGFAAKEDHWLSWDNDAAGARVEIYRLAQAPVLSATAAFSLDVVAAFVDGDRAIAALADQTSFAVWDLNAEPPRLAIAQPFGNAPAILLGLSERTAWFAEGEELGGVDFTVIDAPLLLPEVIALDQPIGKGVLLAFGPTRAAFALDRRLAVYERRATGLADRFDGRGLGVIEELRAQDPGAIGISAESAVWLEPQMLNAMLLSERPKHQAFPIAPPFLVDGPSGSAGVFSGGARLPLNTDLDRVRVDANGAVTIREHRFPAPADPEDVVAALEGCVGVAVGREPLVRWMSVLDRCQIPGSVVDVASIPPSPPPEFVAWEEVRVHGEAWASLLSENYAVLADLRAPTAPSFRSERVLDVGVTGRLIDAACDGNVWVLMWIDGDDAVRLSAIDVATDFSISEQSFERASGVPTRGNVALLWPTLYAGGEVEGQPAVMVYAIDRPNAELLYTLPVRAPIVDLISAGEMIWAAHADGLTLITRACLP